MVWARLLGVFNIGSGASLDGWSFGIDSMNGVQDLCKMMKILSNEQCRSMKGFHFMNRDIIRPNASPALGEYNQGPLVT